MWFHYDSSGRRAGYTLGLFGWFMVTVVPLMVLFGLLLAHPAVFWTLGIIAAGAAIAAFCFKASKARSQARPGGEPDEEWKAWLSKGAGR